MGQEEEQQQEESPCLAEQLPRPASLSLRERIFRRRTWIIRLAGLLILLGSIIATAVTLGRKETIRMVLLWIHKNQVGGGFIFILLYCWFTVVFLPVALLAICAGAVWGLWPGLPLVWVSAMLGETLAFLLGRFLLRKWVRQLTADWPLWQALNAALKEDGWKLVALLRVSPATPFSVINYALGTSSLPFWHYLLPSVIGIIPTVFIETYLGAAAADITSVVSDEGVSAPAAAKIAVTVATAVTAVIGAVLSAVYTKRAIDRRLSHLQVTEQLAVTEQHVRLLQDGVARSSASSGQMEADARSPSGPKSPGAASGEMQVVLYVEEPQLVVVRRPDASGDGAASVSSPTGSSVKASSGLPEGEEVQLLHGMTSSSQSSESFGSSHTGRGQHGQLLSEDGSGGSPLAHGAGGAAPHSSSSSSSRGWSWLRPWKQTPSHQQQQQQQKGGVLGGLVSIAVGARPQRGSGTNVPLLPARESP